MDTTEIVDAVAEPLSDPAYKGVFAGLALAGVLVAAGVTFKKLRARRKFVDTTPIAEAYIDQA